MVIISLSIIPRPIRKKLLFIPTTLCFAVQKFISRGEMLLLEGHIRHPIELEAQNFPSHFGLPITLIQQVKKEIIVLAGVIYPDYLGRSFTVSP